MISYKHITKIIGMMMAAAVAFCFWVIASSQEAVEALGGVRVPMAYEAALFDTDELIQIDIQMEQEEWEEMLDNAMAEEYYACDVLINDQKLYNVGVRPKGNTSLSSIASNPDSDRYSLKLEFDHYVDGQTCLGLDKLILNNNYADATNMKEAVVYDMYQYLGADASLYNYAEISLNGEYLGVYLALEAVEESFLMRNYGTVEGELYKPDSMQMGGGSGGGGFGGRPTRPEDAGDAAGKERWQAGDGQPASGGEGFAAYMEGRETEKDVPADREEPDFAGGMPQGREDFDFAAGDERKRPEMGKMPGKDSSMGGENGANLNYTDEELDSYSDIWEGEVTSTGKADHSRVVTALRHISEGTDLETYLDVDNILKYMAVHAFSVNLDSLSGNMAHNYYLYEHNGVLNILPWDYNLAFGGMNHGSEGGASEVVNDAVDTPFAGTAFFDALLENEAYLSRYHEYLRQLAQTYVLDGRFQEVYQGIRSRIDTLVETDPTALYSYEEYEAGAEMLYQTVLLRAESVKGQIDGAIPATDEEQRADAANLVDASEIDISVMGAMDMGKGGERKSARAADGR
ncbi:MAG: CotH kinase family protein [Lachnospiraceae bacterium]|nr:CotH kinase family protein [Lachnospiraceae bacterium]